MLLLALLISLFPACPTEDATLCVWDASTQGNGTGTSFISLSEDFLIYLP